MKLSKKLLLIYFLFLGSANNLISEETFIFFLIKPYKLKVRATVIPIQGTSPSFIRK